MSSKVISGGAPGFSLCSKPYNPTKRSMLEPCSHLSCNTHFSKPNLSFRSPSGSYRTRTRASINAVYSPEKTTESFYDLLGIPESGNLLEIKKAYKQLARKYHPDVSPPDRTEEYTQRFIRVQEAYETLSDPQTRALYDSDLAKGLHLAFSGRKRGQYDQAQS
ncbi:unnamed protein product [Ilex paraguariensis]|uniref:J domain-containing protein n=1 Tax=Ilex paraguariensis TaxID=185542 RepID=A0ABC8RBH4_9AQUA